MERNKAKVSSSLVVTGTLTGGLTFVWSSMSIILSIIALLFRNDCEAGNLNSVFGQRYIMVSFLRAYVLETSCAQSLRLNELMHPDTLFVIAWLTLCLSSLSIIVAIALPIIVTERRLYRFIPLAIYIYSGLYVAILVVDLVLATHFGLDFSHMNSLMDYAAGSEANYFYDAIRFSAFFMMFVSLKGIFAHCINIALVSILLYHTFRYQTQTRESVHAIHKMGALNAFGSHDNTGFVTDDEPPRPPRNVRDTPLTEPTSSRGYDRSDSWFHTGSEQIPERNTRPFSYLEDIRRSTPPRSVQESSNSWRKDWNQTAGPDSSSSWRRDWNPPPPPVPAPDYSPQQGRRLKSALKPAYL